MEVSSSVQRDLKDFTTDIPVTDNSQQQHTHTSYFTYIGIDKLNSDKVDFAYP